MDNTKVAGSSLVVEIIALLLSGYSAIEAHRAVGLAAEQTRPRLAFLAHSFHADSDSVEITATIKNVGNAPGSVDST
jgi:hypothetical protein